MTRQHTAPELMPVLSAGRHRNPRKGACFMEMASFLAGERWSDHPCCVHPLLAALARLVNDTLPDEQRHRLSPMIPDVIGLTGDDVRVDVRLALLCAAAALPIAAEPRQNVLAVGVLTSERILATLDDRRTDELSPQSRDLLARAPAAAQWAERFTRQSRTCVRDFRRVAAPKIVALSVLGIAEAAVPDTGDRLVDLLAAGIAETRTLVTSAGHARLGSPGPNALPAAGGLRRTADLA